MKMVIIGGGISGMGAAKLGVKLGYDVFLSDAGTIADRDKQVLHSLTVPFEEGGHGPRVFDRPELVVKSPGVPADAEVIRKLAGIGVRPISEIEFASRHTKAKIIAITGTNGKTTTAMLMAHILKKAEFDVALGGNVGESFAGLLANGDKEYFVLEISSFQLDDTEGFRPGIAVLLNLTPDHLDRYGGKMEAYIASKFSIVKNQGPEDHFIYVGDDPILADEVQKRDIKPRKHPISLKMPVEDGAFVQNDILTIQLTDKPVFEMSIYELALQGNHNAYNSMAAAMSARLLDVRKDVIRESLMDFRNIEHRLEPVAVIHGIKFINDSKATNVNSTWYALETVRRPVVWIVGGVDKGNDYTILETLVRQKVKAIICLGRDNRKLRSFFNPIIEMITEADSAEKAVSYAYQFADKGDTVLLSPACASFDLFDNYEDRGRKFKQAVRSL